MTTTNTPTINISPMVLGIGTWDYKPPVERWQVTINSSVWEVSATVEHDLNGEAVYRAMVTVKDVSPGGRYRQITRLGGQASLEHAQNAAETLLEQKLKQVETGQYNHKRKDNHV